MPDNSQPQTNPEVSEVQGEVGNQRPSEAPEIVRNPDPSKTTTPADDKAAIQNVQSTLQGGQNQGQPIAPAGQGSSPAKKPGSSEPYIKAAENVIERDKNDPYKEEEDHEDVQIQYLHDRFGKDIKKS